MANAAKGLSDRMVARGLAVGGTCTGEHGIGLGKKEHLRAQHGEAVEVMALIKQALDPENLMNPGKVLDLQGHHERPVASGPTR